MYKKITTLLLATICSKLLTAQKLTTKDITGSWQVSSMLTNGLTIPMESEEALRTFMYSQAKEKKGKKNASDATLTGSDSSALEMGVQILGMLRESEFTFSANNTFKFTLANEGDKKDVAGTWSFNEAAQTMKFAQIKKGKPEKSEIVKILAKGSKLFLQMEKDMEEGLLLSKK
jgi:hypothetical protein